MSTTFPEPDERLLELLAKKKDLDALIKSIEKDEDYSKYLEQVKEWFLNNNSKGVEIANIDFRFAKWRASEWWRMKPYEFRRLFPDFATEHADKLFEQKPTSGRLTIKKIGV